jgi:hypothetical protein
MLNGFVLEINNENGFECEVPLFLDYELPAGVIIKTNSGEFSFKNLVFMAQSEKFSGSGFQSDIIKKVVLISPNGEKALNTPTFSKKQEIILDGMESYLNITIPAKSVGIFQLLPFL